MATLKSKSVLLVLVLRLAFIFSVTGRAVEVDDELYCSKGNLEVSYGDIDIACGGSYNVRNLGYLEHPPTIVYKDADKDGLYTLVMVVMKLRPYRGPARDEAKNYVNWYITNIEGSKLLNKTEDFGGFPVVQYRPCDDEFCWCYFLLSQHYGRHFFDRDDLRFDEEAQQLFMEPLTISQVMASNKMFTFDEGSLRWRLYDSQYKEMLKGRL